MVARHISPKFETRKKSKTVRLSVGYISYIKQWSNILKLQK